MKYKMKYYDGRKQKMLSRKLEQSLPVHIYPNFIMSIGNNTYRYEDTHISEGETIYYFVKVNIDGYQ